MCEIRNHFCLDEALVLSARESQHSLPKFYKFDLGWPFFSFFPFFCSINWSVVLQLQKNLRYGVDCVRSIFTCLTYVEVYYIIYIYTLNTHTLKFLNPLNFLLNDIFSEDCDFEEECDNFYLNNIS